MVGVGLTVTVAVKGVPVQPLASGVIVNVTVIGAVVGLINVPLIVPDPLAPIVPVTVAVLSLVQLKTVPGTLPVNVIGVMDCPVQTVWLADVPQPLILFTVNVPTLGQAVPLEVPRIHPEATTTPSHLTSHRQELSLNVPCASMKKVNGPFVAGAVPDSVGGGLNR
jgi:hypothetical protein